MNRLSFNYFAILFLISMCPKSSQASVAEGGSITASQTTTRKPKTIYLIRHAESEENRRIAALSRTFKALGKFSLPKSSDVYASTELLNVPGQVDSNVSEIGSKQIANMKEKLLGNDFVKSTGIQLVAHSPLLRARQTSEGMMGCMSAATDSNADLKAETVNRVIQTNLLLEKTPSEWTPLYYSTFIKRIADMEQWLWEQEEDIIALVGHSQFFKKMLNLEFKFGNCDVWKVTFDLNKAKGAEASEVIPENDEIEKSVAESEQECKWLLPPQWSNLELKYACEVMSSQKTIS